VCEVTLRGLEAVYGAWEDVGVYIPVRIRTVKAWPIDPFAR